MIVRYVPQSGDALYTFPAGAFGFAFSRGTDPGGATLPSAVVQRANRVYLLRPASAYGVTGATYVCLTPLTSAYGESVDGFLTFVGLAWNNATGTDAAPPTSLAAAATVFGWTAA